MWLFLWLCKTKIWRKKAKLCYIDTESFIVYIKADNIYKNIAVDLGTSFDTSNYDLDRPSPKRKKKKIIGLKIDELGGKQWKNFLN